MSRLVILGYAFGGFVIFAGLMFVICTMPGVRVIPCIPPPLKSEPLEPEDDALSLLGVPHGGSAASQIGVRP